MFTDASGCQMKFDQRVGSNKWPRQVQFSGPHVHFLFHSDNSNTEWGYKFKVSSIRELGLINDLDKWSLVDPVIILYS